MASKSRLVDGVSKAWKLAMGDVLAYGHERYGEECHQILDTVYALLDPENKGRQQAYNMTWVSSNIPDHLRQSNVSWTILREAAAIPKSERKKWIDIAERDNLSTRDFKKAVEPLKHVTRRNRPEKTVEDVSVDVEPEEVDSPTHVVMYLPNEAYSHLCALTAQDNADRGLEQSPKEYLLFLIDRLYMALNEQPEYHDVFDDIGTCTSCGSPRDIPLARGGYLSRCTKCRNAARRK